MNRTTALLRTALSAFLIPLVAFSQTPPPAKPAAEPAAKSPAPAAPMREVLKLRVLEGQDAVNDLVRRISVPPVIEVRDENDRPLEGADVVFRLPVTGPGGIFPGQQMVQKSRTNVQGQATVVGYQANGVPGQFTIAVTATRNDQMGQITVRQTNGQELGLYPPKKKSRKWLWIGIAAAAGGAVAGILVARGGGSSSTAATTPTITITPGPITIGGH